MRFWYADEPQGIPETHNLTLAGWNAAPTAAEIIARAAPLGCAACQSRFKREKMAGPGVPPLFSQRRPHAP